MLKSVRECERVLESVKERFGVLGVLESAKEYLRVLKSRVC